VNDRRDKLPLGAHIAQQPKRIQELDGWRAISVALVVVHHTFSWQYPNPLIHSRYLAHVIFYAGPFGVKTFFVISGFVICRLLIAEEAQYGSVSLKAFYYRRIFRIIPPFYLFLAAISLLLAGGLIREQWRVIALGGLFLSDIFMPVTWFVGHTWSLAVEEQFYIVFPTMWILTKPWWRGRVFGGVFLLCIGLTFLKDFACISFGVWMAIHETRVRRFASRIPLAVVLAVVLVMLVHPIISATRIGSLFDTAFMPLGLGLMMLYSLERGKRLSVLLCSKPFQAAGLTSYGIYLWQQLFTGPLYDYLGLGAFLPFMLPLLLAIVPLSYFFIEKPSMQFGKSLSRRARESASIRIAVAK
jgi:peptidoglycan/LPS O-acetylase OafA/YrhL